ncbi:beta-glucosidase [Truncatella angustata]|uniref:Beta-glucosidase n=1 Tax=Truncatella angustata TaxID=152316 RepID=A0A9P8UXC2_9PEZI|nr:beta-glucosidase [Truncatella angustata]KAH6660100.1 beta-glucosidase [Truncatella angustata]
MNLAFAATLAAAQPHNHGHGHLHQKKGSPVEKRADVVTTIEAATETAYVLGDKVVTPDEAKAGIEKGLYIVVGETTPTYTAPAVSSTAETGKVNAQFFEYATKKSSSSATSSSSTSSTTIVTSYSAAKPTSSSTSTSAAAATTSKASSSSGGSGVTAEFPSGEIDCSQFPSDYGAVAVDYLNTDGWTSIQQTPYYTEGDSAISYIVTGISGDSCTKGSFCSYACPDGYVKSQWPDAQGATGQSIGGLYCNSKGKLELTRSGYTTLCQKGCGGITIKNKLSSGGAAVCRTDYPGTESMVIPLWTEAGSSYDLTNIESANYYTWGGASTTLQYYVNPKDVAVDDACVWTSLTNPLSAGNWAPINVGLGKNSEGLTFLSIFNNAPTSTAVLDFDVVISGDIVGDAECYYKSGSYPDGGTGCTVAVTDGGSATITFQES